MKLLKFKRYYFVILAFIILFFDQITKYIIIKNYDFLINKDYFLFTIDFIKNNGAAFNLFSGSRIFLSIISILISFTLFYLILRKKTTTYIHLLSYSFILGGSLGNGFDRIINGYVIDFIKLNYIEFPIFNIADISINIGFILILLTIFKIK